MQVFLGLVCKVKEGFGNLMQNVWSLGFWWRWLILVGIYLYISGVLQLATGVGVLFLIPSMLFALVIAGLHMVKKI